MGCSSRKLGQLIEDKDTKKYKIVGTYVGVIVVHHDFGVMTWLLHIQSGNLQALGGVKALDCITVAVHKGV